MSWIRRFEAAHNIDGLRKSHSITGKHHSQHRDAGRQDRDGLEKYFDEYELLEESPLGRTETNKFDRFLRGRQIAHTIYEHFRVTGTNETILEF